MSENVATWLRQLDEAGLVFLRHRSTITLVDEAGELPSRPHIDYDADEQLELGHRTATRRLVTAEHGVSGWSTAAPLD